MNLNHWLKKTPQPTTVRASMSGAEDQLIAVPKNARAYRDLVETIRALNPSGLTCLDKDGNVIRSTILYNEDEEEAPPPSPSSTQDQSDLQLFAKLLAEGYDRGAKTNQPLLNQAMEFCDRQGQRLAKAEAEIDKLRNTIHRLTLQIGELSLAPEEAPKEGGSIVDAMVAGVLQAQATSLIPGAVTPIKNAKGA